MAAGTFTVAGERVRTSSQRRFVAWVVRRKFDGARYTDEVASREIFARSDEMRNIRVRIARQGFHSGRHFVIIDTVTGEQM